MLVMRRFELPDARATERLGACFAAHLQAPASVWLEGELGSGKTTFCRGFLRAAGHRGAVTSPTYPLLETYSVPGPRAGAGEGEAGGLTVFHLDLYRLSDADEFVSAGLDDCFTGDGVCLVEWPRNVRLPPPDVALHFEWADGDHRRAWVEARDAALLQAAADDFYAGASGA